MADNISSRMDKQRLIKMLTYSKEIINDCRNAKEIWLNTQCEEIEELENNIIQENYIL